MPPRRFDKGYVFLVLSKHIIPKGQSKLVGEDAQFLCPFHSSQWLFNNKPLPVNAKARITDKQLNVLELHDIKLANRGSYSCIWIENGQKYYDEVFLNVEGTLSNIFLYIPL